MEFRLGLCRSLLANQLAIALVRDRQLKQRGRALKGDGRLCQKVIDALSFQLTGSQRLAWAEIAADLAAEHRLLRLLQGDVGSGKTVVALPAMPPPVDAGGRAALLAPTRTHDRP